MKFYLKSLLTLAFGAAAVASQAQIKVPWVNNVNISGYGMIRYQNVTKDGAKSNGFSLRFARFSLDGRAFNDFYWKAQIQVNGNTSTLGASPRLVDLFVEWQKFDFMRIKVGQFKNPFTFENPMNPIDQGFNGYGTSVINLAGFNDRAGGHSSNGRDIGLQVQGDFLKSASGRNLLHYQVGVFNGQGINVSDVDQQKNVIGGIWVMPIKGMRLGAFGWVGSYARKGTSATEGITSTTLRKLQQRRYAFSAEYKADDWTLRSEYIHSTGKAFAKALVNSNDASSKDITLSNLGDKAQGVYALVIAPVIKEKFHVKARYDMYQPEGLSRSMQQNWEFGADYIFAKRIGLTVTYAFNNNRALQKHNYQTLDAEVTYKF